MRNLKIDYSVNPVGIGNETPRLFWQNDKRQVAFEIKSFLDEKKKICDYDSGKVLSNESVGIEYGGSPLKSGERRYVEVTAYYEDGSEEKSDGFFEAGLLEKSDWKGAWVGTPANFAGENLILRKEFELKDKPISKARVYLAAIGYHELYINGEKPDDRKLAPSQTDYTKRIAYVTYCVEKLLKGGKNAITVSVGNGWFGKKVALAQIEILYKDGEKYEDATNLDGLWWQTGGEAVKNSVYGGETFDSCRKDIIGDYKFAGGVSPDWSNGWLYAFRSLSEKATLVPDLIEPIKVNDTFSVKNVTKLDNGETVYDFGYNVSGWVKIVVKGTRGSSVIIRHAEDLKEDGSVNTLNLRSAAATDKYILRGEGVEVYAPSFTYHGFRYVQISTDGEVEIISAEAEHVYNSVRETGGFSCSDEVLNSLHEMAVLTEKNNLHSIMTDCPQRDERLMWLNDLSSRIYQNVNNFDLAKILKKCVEDFIDAQRDDGAIPDTAPFIGGNIPADPISAALPLFAVFGYRYYGDMKIVEIAYEPAKKWVKYLLSQSENGFLSLTSYGDWVIPDAFKAERVSGAYISTAYLYFTLSLVERLAEITESEEDKRYFAKEKENCKKVLQEIFFDPEKISYENGSQVANALAVSFGFADNRHIDRLVEKIADDVVLKNYHISAGNQGYKHVLYALFAHGYQDVAIKSLVNPEYPGWGYMVKCGATTVWERWEKEMQSEMHSFDHPMFSAYDGTFYNYVLGINADEEAFGFDKVTISPVISRLTEAKGYIDTIRGRISVECTEGIGGTEYAVDIPCGISAKFVNPKNGEITVLKTGRTIISV